MSVIRDYLAKMAEKSESLAMRAAIATLWVLLAASLMSFMTFLFHPDWAARRGGLAELVPVYSLGDRREEIRILQWTGYFSTNDSMVQLEAGTKRMAENCELPVGYRKCVWTQNRTDLQRAGAVVFNWQDLLDPEVIAVLPKHQSVNQLFVYVNEDEPMQTETRSGLEIPFGFFNRTISMRMDSDYPLVYSTFSHTDLAEVDVLSLKKKGQLISTQIPNADTASPRLTYATHLESYLGEDLVHIYSNSTGRLLCASHHSTECSHTLQSYYFHLVIEDNNCKNVISQEFFTALSQRVVPIVDASYIRYSDFAPPNSFIDASQFDSFQELADELLRLSENTTDYLSYLQWQNIPAKQLPFLRGQLNNNPYCRLCEELQNDYEVLAENWYDDIERWFLDKDCVEAMIMEDGGERDGKD